LEYPKIETLYNRDEKFNVIEGNYRLPEFKLVDKWFVTEKIDGVNVQIHYYPDLVGTGQGHSDWFELMKFNGMKVDFFGRTEKTQFHPSLLDYLKKTFTVEKLGSVFEAKNENNGESCKPEAWLFMEGYGHKIQKGGNYRSDISCRLFDVYIPDKKNNPMGGWWLKPEAIENIALKLGIQTVPTIGIFDTHNAVLMVSGEFDARNVDGLNFFTPQVSVVAFLDGGTENYLAEGIVARTVPMLFTRRGERLMWKLKVKDFKHGEKSL